MPSIPSGTSLVALPSNSWKYRSREPSFMAAIEPMPR